MTRLLILIGARSMEDRVAPGTDAIHKVHDLMICKFFECGHEKLDLKCKKIKKNEVQYDDEERTQSSEKWIVNQPRRK